MCLPLWVGLATMLLGIYFDVSAGMFPFFTVLLFIGGAMIGMMATVFKHQAETAVGEARKALKEDSQARRFWQKGLPPGPPAPTVAVRRAVAFQSQPGMLGAAGLLAFLFGLSYMINRPVFDSWAASLLHPAEWEMRSQILAGAVALLVIALVGQFLIASRTYYCVQPPWLTLRTPFSQSHLALEEIE